MLKEAAMDQINSDGKKREVPPVLKRVLEFDKDISGRICSAAEKKFSIEKWKPTFKLLEVRIYCDFTMHATDWQSSIGT